ncbi:MAG: hypothetical protein ACKVOE_01890 [Rickettsiales bacterium]
MQLPDIGREQHPEQLLGDILSYVVAAEALLKVGDTVRLAGLDTVVDVLCQRVLALPAAESKEYAPELEHLNERLTQLAGAIEAAKAELGDDMDALDKRQRAAKAYLKKPEA